MKHLLTIPVLVAMLVLASAQRASGDGLPIVGLDTTGAGIRDEESGAGYFALPDRRGGDATTLIEVRELPGGDQAMRTTRMSGTLAVPGVAFDGTTAGLAADGGTLALIEPRTSFPRTNTRMVVVDTGDLRIREQIDLRGDFSFDAISPDGSRIFLIHYLNPRTPGEYEVRAWDVERGELAPDPIIDRRTAPTVMRGFPMTRADSPDGAWAFTLYDGRGRSPYAPPGRHGDHGHDPDGGAVPFVHALNTAEGSALCVDLDMLTGVGVGGYGIEPDPDGRSVAVVDRMDEVVATFSTVDWIARAPSLTAGVAGSGRNPSLGAILAGSGIAFAGALLIAAAWLGRRRPRSETIGM